MSLSSHPFFSFSTDKPHISTDTVVDNNATCRNDMLIQKKKKRKKKTEEEEEEEEPGVTVKLLMSSEDNIKKSQMSM